jgi:hypothetical protein
MSDGEEIVTERTGGGARAPQARCFRRIHGETTGACRYYPISAAEYQADQREKSALENCDEKVEGEVTFAEEVSEEVMSESPAPPPSPPAKQTCPAVVKGHESPVCTIQNKIPTIHAADDSEGPSGGCDSPLAHTEPPMTFDSTPGSASISPTQEPACGLLSFGAAAGFGSGCSPGAGQLSRIGTLTKRRRPDSPRPVCPSPTKMHR